jgi:DNA-binding CsgD family transcriptional regulator
MKNLCELLERRGIAVRPMLAQLRTFSAADLTEPTAWHAWDDFVTFMQWAEEALGGPWGVGRLCAEMIESSMAVRLLFGTFDDVRELMLHLPHFMASRFYRHLGARVTANREHMVFEARLPPQYRGCATFFGPTSFYGFEGYAKLAGVRASVVDVQYSTHHGRYVIALPEPGHTTDLAPQRRLLGLLGDGLDEASLGDTEWAHDSNAVLQVGREVAPELTGHESASSLGEAVARWLARRFLCQYVALWSNDARGEARLSYRLGSEVPPHVLVRSLTVGDLEVGRLQVDLQELPGVLQVRHFTALLPWLGFALRDCQAVDQRSQRDRVERVVAMARRSNLTVRQCEVLELLGSGFANKEIAQALGTSVKTVEAHVGVIMRKVGVESRAQLLAIL